MSTATSPEKPKRDLSQSSLDEVENFYQRGIISEEEVVAYLRLWNAGPHFTQAVLFDGRIRNFDPEKSADIYRNQQEKFGLILPPKKS